MNSKNTVKQAGYATRSGQIVIATEQSSYVNDMFAENHGSGAGMVAGNFPKKELKMKPDSRRNCIFKIKDKETL